MSDYGFNNVYEKLSVQNILNRVSGSMLWRYYLGIDYELKKNYRSPLRPNDENPSFNLYEDKRDRIMFKDFGAGGAHGDIFDFLQIRDFLTLPEALVKVNVDFRLGLGKPGQQSYFGSRSISAKVEKQLNEFEEKFVVQTTKLINAHTRPWTDKDLSYWLEYGITKETLKLYDIYCISRIKIRGPNGIWVLVYSYTESNPCYGYYFKESKHIKCYFPMASGDQLRFVGNVNNYQDVQGYYQCNVKKDKKNKLLILTKSMKDCMCLRELGYEAMAIHGEAQYFYKDFIRHIKKYYPVVISLYDRDKTGMKGAGFLWKTHRIRPYFIPKTFIGAKDISDVHKMYNRNKAEEIMKKIEMDCCV